MSVGNEGLGNKLIVKKTAEEITFPRVLIAVLAVLLLGLVFYFGGAALYKRQEVKVARSISRLEEQIARNPRNETGARAQYVLAQFYDKILRDYDKSVENYEKVLTNYANSSWCDDSLLRLGFLHTRQHNYDKTLESYRRIITTYPDSELSVKVHKVMGNLFCRQKKHGEAEKLYQEFILKYQERKRDIVQVRFRLADCYKVQKKHEEAVEIYQDIIDSQPDEKQAAYTLFLKAQCHERLGNYGEARADYKQLIVQYADVKEVAPWLRKAHGKLEKLKNK